MVPALMTPTRLPSAASDNPISDWMFGRTWLRAMKSYPSKNVATLRKTKSRLWYDERFDTYLPEL